MNTKFLYSVLVILIIHTTLAQTPDWQWAKRGGGSVNLIQGSEVFSTELERIIDLAIDSNDNYYFLAEVGASQTDYDGSLIQTYSTEGGRKDIFVVSTDCQGDLRWSKTIGGGFDDWPTSVSVDNDNNVYVSGVTINTQSEPVHFDNDSIKAAPVEDGNPEEARKGMFIIKYDDQGNYQWLQEPEGPVDYFGAPLQKTVIEPSGRTHSLVRFGPGTHLDGQLTVTEPLGQSAIIVYDSNANLENYILIDLEPGLDRYDYQLAYDPNLDRYYIADTVRGTEPELSINGFGAATGDDKAFYLAAIDNQGQVLWYHENSVRDGWAIGDIALDDNGDIYFTGRYNNDIGNSDTFASFDFIGNPNTFDEKSPFLLKLDPSGNLIWGTNALEYSPFPGRSLAIEGNDVYLGLGSLFNEWDGMPFGTTVSGVGLLSTDNAVLRFNKTTGDLQEVIPMPSASLDFDMIMAMDIDSQGNIVVGGHFGGTLLSGNPNGSITNIGGDTDFFIAQWGDGNCSLGTETPVATSEVQLYPQPADQVLKLKNGENIESYRIYDLAGKLLQEGKVHEARVNIGALPSGLYVIRLKDRSQDHYSKRLIVE